MEQILKNHIEQLFYKFANENKFFKSNFSNLTYELYLQGAYYLVSNTVPCLTLAKEESLIKNDPVLADFFVEKIEEESGHEIWAKNDFEKTFKKTFNEPNVAPTMKGLVRWLYQTIQNDPVRYLAYVLYIEYFTVLSGSPVEEKFRSQVRTDDFSCVILAAHVELDKSHIIDDLKVISEQFAERKMDIEILKETITQAHQHVMEFYSEITELGMHREAQL